VYYAIENIYFIRALLASVRHIYIPKYTHPSIHHTYTQTHTHTHKHTHIHTNTHTELFEKHNEAVSSERAREDMGVAFTAVKRELQSVTKVLAKAST
jgi:carbohydrate-binding DOMON domain-containing protein